MNQMCRQMWSMSTVVNRPLPWGDGEASKTEKTEPKSLTESKSHASHEFDSIFSLEGCFLPSSWCFFPV
jgi:hypothetical protein